MSKTQRKLQNMHNALLKEKFEKTFWQRKVKYYAPNRMQEHFAELENLWTQFCVEAMEGEVPVDNAPIPDNLKNSHP